MKLFTVVVLAGTFLTGSVQAGSYRNTARAIAAIAKSRKIEAKFGSYSPLEGIQRRGNGLYTVYAGDGCRLSVTTRRTGNTVHMRFNQYAACPEIARRPLRGSGSYDRSAKIIIGIVQSARVERRLGPDFPIEGIFREDRDTYSIQGGGGCSLTVHPRLFRDRYGRSVIEINLGRMVCS